MITWLLHSATSTGYLFNTGLLKNSVHLHTLFIFTRHHLISQTLSLRQHQSVLVDGFGPAAVLATSSHGWDSNLVSAVSHMLHQPPGNPLPPSLQQLTYTDTFKRQLKTVLFERSFLDYSHCLHASEKTVAVVNSCHHQWMKVSNTVKLM